MFNKAKALEKSIRQFYTFSQNLEIVQDIATT